MIAYLMDLFKESIPILGIIITAVVSITVLKHESWLKAVSASRNHWLNEFRSEVAIIVGAINMIKHQDLYLSEKFKDDEIAYMHKAIYDAEVAKARLYTRLNTNTLKGNEYNSVLKQELTRMIFSNQFCNAYNVIALQELVNRILEIEWQKVKKESKGEIE